MQLVLTTLLQNELNNDVTRFTTHIKTCFATNQLLKGLNVSGKTRNIAIKLVLQQCCKTMEVARFLLPVFPYLQLVDFGFVPWFLRNVTSRITWCACAERSNLHFGGNIAKM